MKGPGVPEIGDTVVWRARVTGAERSGRVLRVVSAEDRIEILRYASGPKRYEWLNISDIKEIHRGGVRGGG